MDRTGLALLAGDTLIASVTTSTWPEVRLEVAELFGSGSPDWKTLRRLDATHAELATATYGSLRRVRVNLAREWSVRFKDLLTEHPGIEVDVASIVAGIRTKNDEEPARPAESERVRAGGGVRLLPQASEFTDPFAESVASTFHHVVRWTLIGSAAIAALVAFTHRYLVARSAINIAVPWAHWLLTWPTSSAQPILAGCAAICLLAIALSTQDWQKPTERAVATTLASGLAAILGAGPMIVVCMMVAYRFAV